MDSRELSARHVYTSVTAAGARDGLMVGRRRDVVEARMTMIPGPYARQHRDERDIARAPADTSSIGGSER